MVIYLEVAILDNFLINFILLYLTAKFFKQKIKKTNFVLASLVGTIFALLFPLINANNFVLLLLKILLGFVIVYVAFLPKKAKQFVQFFVCFLVLTFLLGGFVFAVFEMLNININNFVLLSNSSLYPISLFLMCVIGFVKLMLKFFKLIFRNAKINRLIYNVKIKVDNKQAKTQAFFDSGNTLKDEKMNLPVCIISQKLFSKLYPNFDFLKLILKKEIDLKDGHYIYYSTISGSKNSMFVFKPDELKIFNGESWIEGNSLLGVSLAKVGNGDKFDILLNGLCEV